VRTLFTGRLNTILVAAAVLTTTLANTRTASAQAAANPVGANATKFGIAVVDIPYIFKNYPKFKATTDAMKKEMETIDADVKADRAKIAQMEQQRNTFQPGTPDYKKYDEELARMMAEFQLKTGKLQKDFMERQAKLYYQTYQEVEAKVNEYAKRNNIGLVLRFNGEPVDPNRREDVMRDINKQVVVQNSIDITPDVLALLQQGSQLRTTQQPAAGAFPQR
jgi:Skp family chaperone for outer membrane proteins